MYGRFQDVLSSGISAEPKPMLSSMFSLSSSSQNNTEKQITSQKSSSSIDCRHFNFAVSICPAAGQVVENTPCPAVNFFLNFQLIISNPCSHG